MDCKYTKALKEAVQTYQIDKNNRDNFEIIISWNVYLHIEHENTFNITKYIDNTAEFMGIPLRILKNKYLNNYVGFAKRARLYLEE